ncbi:DUF6542 domain-containing protein [Streptomyces tagetis]|uniref:DUF6542 domain-containing protein n=1 Tax=Streptomyces tagetis TaxID=2820809 RepID=A0A941B3M9_9ACTN|nr:DUF6542 domain-containing protein [Streptomyces sp. RG38]MBQ0828402.1 hypothetical protein [Streptomyces sp. RG38]
MEQHRTRPAQYGPRRGRARLPPQGRGAADGVRRARPLPPGDRRPATAPPRPGTPAPPAARALPGLSALRFPALRLTGLGGGLFCTAVMVVLGLLDWLLFGASLTVYGALFLPVCVLTALWVRGNDLLTAPVSVPIGFTAGLVTVAESGDGVSGRLMGLVTGLATGAGWLYTGTLIAGVTVLVRRVRLVRRRAAARTRPPQQHQQQQHQQHQQQRHQRRQQQP